ncbi:MAG: hypothetical protein WCE30_00580 [Mycobacterium sp.]
MRNKSGSTPPPGAQVTAPVDLTPTQKWQALVPALKLRIEEPRQTRTETETPTELAERAEAKAVDTAERLLLLLHYSIDWENSWVGREKSRKRYWDEALPGRVWHAARRATTLGQWWSNPALQDLGIVSPSFPDRRLELAALLNEPSQPVLRVLRNNLPALLLRVRIITEAVAAQRKATRQ